MSSAIRFLVSGKVQGVGFRASTQEQARRLGLSGYVRNLDDGRVEILAAGAEAALDAFAEWLWQGPPLSRVEAVDRQDAVARADRDRFEIR
jgi:acylphosphatase